MHDKAQVIELENDWATNPRWDGIIRKYPASEVVRLRGSIQLHYMLAEMGYKFQFVTLPGFHTLNIDRG